MHPIQARGREPWSQALGLQAACGSIQGNDTGGPNTQGPHGLEPHLPSEWNPSTHISQVHGALLHLCSMTWLTLLKHAPCTHVALATVTDASIIARHRSSETHPLHSFPRPPRQAKHCAGCLFSRSWLTSTGSVHLTPERSVQRLRLSCAQHVGPRTSGHVRAPDELHPIVFQTFLGCCSLTWHFCAK